jgi:hypothetical protein
MDKITISRKELEEKLVRQLEIKRTMSDLREAIVLMCGIQSRFQKCVDMRTRAAKIHKELSNWLTDLREGDTLQSILIGENEFFIYPDITILEEREGGDFDL